METGTNRVEKDKHFFLLCPNTNEEREWSEKGLVMVEA
jgi:hypothetical protein